MRINKILDAVKNIDKVYEGIKNKMLRNLILKILLTMMETM